MKDIWCRDHRGRAYDFDEYLELVRDFHGYAAPGVMIGGAMVEAARSRLPERCLIQAVCETGTCLPDAVQLLTLCTTGNGRLKVIDSGRYALSLYDKETGRGFRAALDPEKLAGSPVIKSWLFKEKPKREQDEELLYGAIEREGAGLLKVTEVLVDADLLKRKKLGAIGWCPECGEPYPQKDGEKCRNCAGEKYFR